MANLDNANPSEPLYSVGTYDWDRSRYTPQHGLSVPSFNITIAQLRQAIRDLKQLGYSAHRCRSATGCYDCNDSNVLIERTDGKPWREILRGWDRWPYEETRRDYRARLRNAEQGAAS